MNLNLLLSGKRILVTRPAQRADKFLRMVQQAGGEPIAYPVITITEPDNTRHRSEILNNLATYQIAIFISPTSVEKTFEEAIVLPDTLKLVAIGKSTAQTLTSFGCELAFEAKTYDSESLLAQPEMQSAAISQQKIIIFRGEGGRELLADTLKERGAEVVYADMYKRTLPETSHLQLAQLKNLDAVCITSNQGLENLIQLCDNPAYLKKLPLFVPGQRALDLANTLKFRTIHQAANATDAAMFSALTQWAASLSG